MTATPWTITLLDYCHNLRFTLSAQYDPQGDARKRWELEIEELMAGRVLPDETELVEAIRFAGKKGLIQDRSAAPSEVVAWVQRLRNSKADERNREKLRAKGIPEEAAPIVTEIARWLMANRKAYVGAGYVAIVAGEKWETGDEVYDPMKEQWFDIPADMVGRVVLERGKKWPARRKIVEHMGASMNPTSAMGSVSAEGGV